MVNLEIADLADKLDQNCQVEVNSDPTKKSSAKKKKNKKKSGEVEPLNSFYEKALRHYPIQLKNTKAKGRHAVAAENLKEGTILCTEQATAFVVRSDFIDQQCHVCLDDLEGEKLMCSDCNKSYYCSKSCKENDDLHPIICGPISQVDAIGRSTDVDSDLLRLMTILMACKERDEKSRNKWDGDGEIHHTPYWCVDELVSHRDLTEPAFINVVTEASQRLLYEMPESMHIPVEEMVTLACRINSNSHGLGDNQSRNTDAALGLFPLCALFYNHGCNPNATFVGLPNGELAIRTIRPVSKDEELVVSYIDLYCDRDERRQELLVTKHFWCKCKRCTGPIEKSVDRFLHGIVCKECTSDVYVIPPTPMEILVKGQSNLHVSTKPFKCASCGHETACEEVRQLLENADRTYAEGMGAIRQYRDYNRGAKKLESLTKSGCTHSGELHTLNSIRFNSYIPLMNCKRRAGDLKGAIEVNKSILAMMEQYSDIGLLPGNTSEVSDFWQNLGELCTEMASDTQKRSIVLEKKWLKEARAAFSNALLVRGIVFGKNHPKTKAIETLITTLTSSL
ncbi:hypothetical protein EDC94DRAFT_602778 [Helicostylum pulchrum]|uniref:SET domain-containing protein n=1 Tax=Helicostylum pulchrum TaxID=562976 RepID=A0ABP9Y769_9FUNG|nr:hypothetical protein EDC94DRAFT_602778 [Helicostylum pulchrum]